MIVRPLQPADLPTVMRIEQAAMPDPWHESQLVDELAAANGVGFVAECDSVVCGYAFFRTCPPECELLRLVVALDQRRHGVGSGLLEQAVDHFFTQGYEQCFLEVRASNESARRLYGKAGFFQVGIRKKYYRQPIDDALQLCKNLVEIRGENH